MASFLDTDWKLGALVAVSLGLGCNGSGTGADTQTTESDGACSPGLEGCACIEGGFCIADLACASDVCVDLSTLDTGDDEGSGPKPDLPGEDTSETDTSGGSEGSCVGNCGAASPDGCWCDPGCTSLGDCCADYEEACEFTCASSADCANDEVCSPSAGCVSANTWTYDLYVDTWRDYTPDCWDSLPGDCLADAYFDIVVGGETQATSSVAFDKTVATWSTPGTFELGLDEVFAVHFYDWDETTADDYMGTWCFRDATASCDGLPVEVLRAGYFSGYTSGAEEFWVDARFVPR